MKTLYEKIDLQQQEINKLRPLDAHLRKQVKEYFRIGLTYSSNALEGNSLTESETKVILEDGITIGGKPLRDHLEAVGHSDAYDYMHRLASGKAIKEADIKKLHRLFFQKIDEGVAGHYRKVKVFITGSKYPMPAPEAVPMLMKGFMENLTKERELLHPVQFAAKMHKDFVMIHPFVDGNGRVARLLMNLILLREGYCIAIIPPVLRADYIRTIEKAREDDKDFLQFIAEVVSETQKDYLRLFS
ncbi:MAG: Fic family protein [Candidatus Eremiobacteraeota bacterium]|nr:Fic family protein [Candidatus Eremiobacteraeota bacterium]